MSLVVKDSNVALLTIVRKDYADQINEIKREGEKQKEEILSQAKKEGLRRKQDLLLEEEQKQEAILKDEQAKIKEKHARNVAQKETEVLEEIRAEVIKQIKRLNPEKKKELVKKMLEETKSLLEGNQEEYTFQTWEEVKLNGVKNDLKTIGVSAESKKELVEITLNDFILSKEEDLLRGIK